MSKENIEKYLNKNYLNVDTILYILSYLDITISPEIEIDELTEKSFKKVKVLDEKFIIKNFYGTFEKKEYKNREIFLLQKDFKFCDTETKIFKNKNSRIVLPNNYKITIPLKIRLMETLDLEDYQSLPVNTLLSILKFCKNLKKFELPSFSYYSGENAEKLFGYITENKKDIFSGLWLEKCNINISKLKDFKKLKSLYLRNVQFEKEIYENKGIMTLNLENVKGFDVDENFLKNKKLKTLSIKSIELDNRKILSIFLHPCIKTIEILNSNNFISIFTNIFHNFRSLNSIKFTSLIYENEDLNEKFINTIKSFKNLTSLKLKSVDDELSEIITSNMKGLEVFSIKNDTNGYFLTDTGFLNIMKLPKLTNFTLSQKTNSINLEEINEVQNFKISNLNLFTYGNIHNEFVKKLHFFKNLTILRVFSFHDSNQIYLKDLCLEKNSIKSLTFTRYLFINFNLKRYHNFIGEELIEFINNSKNLKFLRIHLSEIKIDDLKKILSSKNSLESLDCTRINFVSENIE
jgi:hypothetical protein